MSSPGGEWQPAPDVSPLGCLAVMTVVASVQRGRRVGHHFIEGDIVRDHPVYIATQGVNHRGTHAQVTRESDDRDVQHIITKAAAIRPPARNNPVAKSLLDFAL